MKAQDQKKRFQETKTTFLFKEAFFAIYFRMISLS